MPRLKDTTTFKKTKRFIKQLIGEDVRIKPQIKRANTIRFGDWCLDPENINENSIIYSLGVGEDVEFDLGIIEKFGTKVHAFDPTPNTIEWLTNQDYPEQFIFHPYGIASKNETMKLFPRVNKRGKKSNAMFSVVEEGDVKNDAVEVQMKKLQTVMNELGHQKIDVLKMDIEASEYSVIADVVNSKVEIDQILVEFHHRFKSVGNEMTIEAVNMLNKAGYKIFFISDLGREYSFIKNH